MVKTLLLTVGGAILGAGLYALVTAPNVVVGLGTMAVIFGAGIGFALIAICACVGAADIVASIAEGKTKGSQTALALVRSVARPPKKRAKKVEVAA